jgi:hypothetical protein
MSQCFISSHKYLKTFPPPSTQILICLSSTRAFYVHLSAFGAYCICSATMLFTFSLATSRLVTAAAVSQMRESRTPRPTDFPTSLPPELQEVIVGCTLGDLSILMGKRSDNARLQFWQGIVNAEYLMHLYSLFESYCGSAPKVYTRHSGKANVYFNTLTSPVFTEFHSLFYLDG